MYILTVFYPTTVFCHFLSIRWLYERSLLSLPPTLAALWRREVTYDSCQIKCGPGCTCPPPWCFEFDPNMFRSLHNEIMNAGKYIWARGVLCASFVHGTVNLMLSPLVSAYPPSRTWRRPALEGRNLTQFVWCTAPLNLVTFPHFLRRILAEGPVAYTGIFFRGGGSTNSVEDRGQRGRGSGGGSPLVRGSGGSCNLIQEISFHMVKFS